MEWSNNSPASKSPRKELQGPRPPPLKINKESHKIKKPPLAPPPSQPCQGAARQPVIIYQVSPKVIHTTPGDFMNLVQRLTGSSSAADSYCFSPHADHKILTDCFSDGADHRSDGGAISPAVRYATIEKAGRSSPSPRHQAGLLKLQYPQTGGADLGNVEDIEMGQGELERPSRMTPGSILSPAPASLSPIQPSFFSPPSSDSNSFSFIHDFSPVLQSNRQHFLEGGFMPSPSNFVSPPHLFHSPTPSFDLFNNFKDLIRDD